MIVSKEAWLSQHRETQSERNIELLSRAYDVLQGNIVKDPNAPWAPYRCISPWIGNTVPTGIWNWDTAFHAMITSYFDTELARDCLQGFMQYQKEDGMFPDVVFIFGQIVDDFTKPPVLPWAVVRHYHAHGDKQFLREAYERFVRNENFWTTKRMVNGLFHYSSEGTPEEIAKDNYLHARYESGWDNSPRWDAPVIEYWPIDLNCFMVTFYRAMGEMADILEIDDSQWHQKESALVEKILTKLYDNSQKCFVDRNFKTGEYSHVITPASFMPLFIHIASQEQADCMHAIASDPNLFFPGMPSVSYNDPTYSTGYWRGTTWLNIAYFASKGLKHYGYDETANAIREFILSMVYDNKDGIYENYNSKERKGLYWHSFSWSACFVIEFILNW